MNIKMNQWLPRLVSARRLICISLFMAVAAKAQFWQWLSNGPPNVVDSQFITTGGITYFRLVALLPAGLCCQRIAGYGVWREGSALNQILQQEAWGGACEQIYCSSWREEYVSVFGTLPPGRYSLTLWAATTVSAAPSPFPWTNFSFTVPANSSPTLSLSATTNTSSPQLLIAVAGVSNAVYVLESSTDLANWTAIRTNVGAPVTFALAVTNEPRRFYRAAVLPTPPRPP